MEDTSLDEFVDGDEREDDAAEESEDNDETGGDTEQSDGDIADGERSPTGNSEPAVSTARWVGSNDSCAGCGAEGVRLWNEDGEFVCQGCKEW